MANMGVELIGFLLSICGLVMTIVACSLPEWKTNDMEGEVIESIRRSSGLWSKCTFYNTGNWQCDQYDKFFLGLPAPLQTARAGVCIALVFQGLAALAAFVGMDCTNLLPSDIPEIGGGNPLKKKIMMAVGILNVISGVILCVGVSFYASTVLEEYHGLNMNMGGPRLSQGQMGGGERYIYGKCLFIGWVAMILDIAAGAIMICGACGSNMVGDASYHYGTAGTNNRLMSNQFQPTLENIVQSGLPKSYGGAKDQQYI